MKNLKDIYIYIHVSGALKPPTRHLFETHGQRFLRKDRSNTLIRIDSESSEKHMPCGEQPPARLVKQRRSLNH